jgi:hypothetical protein
MIQCHDKTHAKVLHSCYPLERLTGYGRRARADQGVEVSLGRVSLHVAFVVRGIASFVESRWRFAAARVPPNLYHQTKPNQGFEGGLFRRSFEKRQD